MGNSNIGNHLPKLPKTKKCPKMSLKGVVALIRNKNDVKEIINCRPITPITIIGKLRAIITTRRITPYMNILTSEQQMAYQQGRSTIGILLALVQNRIKREEPQRLILVHLSNPFDSIDRGYMWAIVYRQGISPNVTQPMKMGHIGTALRAKHGGKYR